MAMVARHTREYGQLVFVDEMGTHTSLAPLVWLLSWRTEDLFRDPEEQGCEYETLLSSMISDGMGPSMTVEGSMTKEVFESYVEYFLAPALLPGQVVVMDNHTAHKGQRGVRDLISRGRDVSCFTCHPTHRTSIPSKKLSQRSRVSCAGLAPGRKKRWWKP
jgi:hypothetical protein